MNFKSFLHIQLLLSVMLIAPGLLAQEGFGTDQPNKSAVIELKSDSRGLLIPRVKLEKTDQFSPITGTANTANSLLVYNTATENDVTPGYYYWSSDYGKWLRLVTSDEISDPGDAVSTWFDQETGEASININDKIYHLGPTAIGKDESQGGAMLDVFGAIRGGDPADVQLGENALAVGVEVEALGDYSTALGYNSRAIGFGSFAGGGYESGTDTFGSGIGGIAKGNGAFAFGYDVKADSSYAIAFGYKTQAQGAYSLAVGRDTRAEKVASFAGGRNNRAKGRYSVALGQNNETQGDHSFTMGRFLNVKTRNEVAFGQYNNINLTGVLPNTWDASHPLFVLGNGEDAGSRNNALTILKNGYTGIGIDGSTAAAKPSEMLDIGKGNVRIRELPDTDGDAVNDKIVVVDDQGVLRSIEASEAESNGPWYDQSSNNPTNNNEANVYQMGNVAVGKNSRFVGETKEGILDVANSIHAGETVASPSSPTRKIGNNAIAVGNQVVGEGDFTATFGYKSKAIGEGAFAGGGAQSETGGEASGKTAFAFGYNAKASGDYSVAFGENVRASGKNETAFGSYNAEINDAAFTVGIGSSSTRKNAFTILRNGNVGIGLPTEAPTVTLDVDGKIKFRDLSVGSSNDKMVVVDEFGVLKAVEQPTGGNGDPSDSGTWFSQANTNELATAANEKVYNEGAVAIGKTSSIDDVSLDVKGAFRAGDNTGTSIGTNSFAAGKSLEASGENTAAFGQYNASYSNALFSIGTGTSNSNRTNALTVNKDGNIGIGLGNAAPGYLLEVGNGDIKFTGLQGKDGTANDRMVVVGNDGILKTVDQPSGDGGNPNPEPGEGPWYDQETKNPTSDNTADIYQIGKVSVGRSSLVIEESKLGVNGAVRIVEPRTQQNLAVYSGDVGDYSLGVGLAVNAPAAYQVTLGRFNSDLGGDPHNWVETDPIFVIGNGPRQSGRRNAVTVLKNGWVGIGSTIPSAVDEPAGHWALGKTLGYYFDDLHKWDEGFFDSFGDDSMLPEPLKGFPGLIADVRQHLPSRVGELGPSFYKTEKLKVAGAITASELYFPDYVF